MKFKKKKKNAVEKMIYIQILINVENSLAQILKEILSCINFHSFVILITGPGQVYSNVLKYWNRKKIVTFLAVPILWTMKYNYF